MAASLCQVMGLMISLLGLAGTMAATAMDQWATQDLSDSIITAVYSYSGLWRSCFRQSSGLTECRPYYTILGLPALLQAVRALMIVSIVAGATGCLVALFALKCLKMGKVEDQMKASLTLTAGIVFLLTGGCGVAGVSAFANLIVQSFHFVTFTGEGLGVVGGLAVAGLMGAQPPRYTFGPALFVGWIGGALLMVGGVMMCLACRVMASEPQQRYDGVAYVTTSQSVYKARTGDYSGKARSVSGGPSSPKMNYV